MLRRIPELMTSFYEEAAGHPPPPPRSFYFPLHNSPAIPFGTTGNRFNNPDKHGIYLQKSVQICDYKLIGISNIANFICYTISWASVLVKKKNLFVFHFSSNTSSYRQYFGIPLFPSPVFHERKYTTSSETDTRTKSNVSQTRKKCPEKKVHVCVCERGGVERGWHLIPNNVPFLR